MKYGLGRLPAIDQRDHNYLLTAPRFAPERTYRYWYDRGWMGDQGNYPHCVGYAWAHFIEDSPMTHPLPGPHVDPVWLYNEAQKVDEWAGENYEGTSVRAGAKVLQRLGIIGEYLWGFDVDTVARNVSEVAPVVAGTNWKSTMFNPDKKGILHIDGEDVGGHAYVINGYNKTKKLFRIKNSWGELWGSKGRAYIGYNDFAMLLSEDGEACLATEPGSLA